MSVLCYTRISRKALLWERIELFILYKDMSPICPAVIHNFFLYFLNVYLLFSFVIEVLHCFNAKNGDLGGDL